MWPTCISAQLFTKCNNRKSRSKENISSWGQYSSQKKKKSKLNFFEKVETTKISKDRYIPNSWTDAINPILFVTFCSSTEIAWYASEWSFQVLHFWCQKRWIFSFINYLESKASKYKLCVQITFVRETTKCVCFCCWTQRVFLEKKNLYD